MGSYDVIVSRSWKRGMGSYSSAFIHHKHYAGQLKILVINRLSLRPKIT
jgi:hypothetical protein